MEKREEGNVSTALFTAGTVLLVVGLKRVKMLLLLFEQWRWWVFLVLNLLLLAIFFTSMRSSSSKNPESVKIDVEMKVERRKKKKKKKQSQGFSEAETSHEDFKLIEKRSQEKEQNEEEKAEDVEDCGEPGKLSKEELNERVEAFIASFRQHLLLDSRRSREPKQSDGFNFQNGSNSCVILPTQGVKCFVFQS